MTETLVIDASIAIKWVIDESGSSEAVALRTMHRFIAPDLLNAECANILWKKVRRGELAEDEARLAASLLTQADVEMAATRPLLVPAMELALLLDHPAYDCIYLALATQRRLHFVTADERLVGATRRSGIAGLSELCVTPEELG